MREISHLLPGMIFEYRRRPDGSVSFPYVSDGIRNIYRVTPEEVSHDASVVHERIHPEDRERMLKAVEQSGRTLEPLRIEYRVKFPDGTVRWLLGYSNAEREADGSVLWHGHIMDVTEAHEREAEAQGARNRLESILQAVPDVLLEVDEHGRYLSVHAHREQDLAQPAEKLIGRTVREIFPREVADLLQDAMHEADSNGRSSLRQYGMMLGGEQRWFEMSVAKAVDTAGGARRYVAISRDVTSRKRVEEELLRSKRELEASNRSLEAAIKRQRELAEQAEQASRAKSAFLATMSHEIRTPLNGVVGMTGLLLSSSLSVEQRGYAEVVGASGESLLQLIDDILDFSKIEAGKIELEAVEFDLRRVCEETLEMLALRADEKALELVCAIDACVPERVRGDPGRLKQVLVNLVGNAVKFTQGGEVVLRVKPPTEAQDEAVLRFEVCDTGIGIPPEKIEQVFDPFTQLDGSTTRRYGGTGLGLAIARQLVALMGGKIEVTSAVGQGSVFRFSIRMPGLAPARRGGLPDGMVARVVSGNAASREALAAMLAAQGASVSCWRGAPGESPDWEAESALADVLVADARLLDEAGEKVLGRAAGGLALTRVVVLAPVGRLAHLPEAVHVVAKPPRLDVLLAAVQGRAPAVRRATRAAGDTTAPMGVAAANDAPAHAKTARLLVVEDNVVNQRVAKALLAKLGYGQVVIANNGQEGVEALARADFDLVLMDCQMPVMDGYAATAAIRDPASGVRNHRVPIVAMTANAVMGDRERCLASGMDDYISKPVQITTLAATLEKWLGERDEADTTS